MDTKKPIHILHVFHGMDCGGAENAIMNIYKCIDKNLVQFDFLVHTNRNCFFDNEIKNLGGAIYRVPYYKLLNVKQYTTALELFFLKHKEINIVHGHLGSCSHIYLKKAKKNGSFTIAHCHSAKPNKFTPTNSLYHYFSWKTRKIADFFFGCSQEAGKWRYGNKIANNPKLFKVINNGIDTCKYKFNKNTRNKISNEINVNNNDVLLGHVGSFYPVKNHKFLINILKEAIKINRNTKLILIGDGFLREGIESQVKELGLEDSVIFTGLRNDVADILQRVDCFVFPSLYEGLPLSVVEAQAASLPCLISDVITDEVCLTPLVVQYSLNNSAKEWAKKALEITSMPRNTSYNYKVAETYDIKKITDDLCDFYRSKKA